MKKLVAALLSLIMLFSLAACGSDASPANDSPVNDSPVSAEATAEPVVEPQPEEVAESTYYGTWKAVSCAQNGITVSVETLEKNDFYLISHSDLILREDGKFYLNILYKETTGEWETTETGIHASDTEIPYNGSQLELLIDGVTIYYEKDSDSAVFPPDREFCPEDICGTWRVIAGDIAANKSTLTLADIKKTYPSYADSAVVFSDEEKAYIKLPDRETRAEWTYADGGIQVDTMALSLVNDLLCVPLSDGSCLYFEKASDDQTLPEVEETTAATGLRPEFKEAMDSYEAFYNEYCDLLKKYMNNPSDLSILTKYMSLMGKLSDMDEKFKAWESEDLNNEELKYYMDVNNRVMKKLLDVTG